LYCDRKFIGNGARPLKRWIEASRTNESAECRRNCTTSCFHGYRAETLATFRVVSNDFYR
jgi:hypothetical protein